MTETQRERGRLRNQRMRNTCKSMGICTTCFTDTVKLGHTKCPSCLETNRIKAVQSRARTKENQIK
jgi:hypothetical protein